MIKRVIGVLLIVAGVLGLMYGGFSFTKESHEAKIGPLELSVKDKQRVQVPVWLSVASIAVGTALLVFGKK